MVRPEPLPLFPEPLPFQRPRIPGFAYGDRVRFASPTAPGRIARGKVLAGLPHSNTVVVRADGIDAILTLKPEELLPA